MKISNSKKKRANKTLVIIVAIATLLLLGTGLAIAYFNNALPIKPSDRIETGTSLEDVNFDTPSEEQVNDGTTKKGESLDETKPDTSTDPSSGKTIISMSIPAINQTNGMVRITSLIQTVTSNGTCTLTLSKNGQEVVKTAPVQALNNSSTCQGFTVDTSELSPGTWQVNLVFENSTHKATAQQAFDVQ